MVMLLLLMKMLLLLLQPVVEKVQLEVEQPHEVAPVAAASAILASVPPDQPVLVLLCADRHLSQGRQLLLLPSNDGARRWRRRLHA